MHTRSLISAFVFRLLESIISRLATSEFSNFQLVSIAEQAGLSLALSETPKIGFVARSPYRHLYILMLKKEGHPELFVYGLLNMHRNFEVTYRPTLCRRSPSPTCPANLSDCWNQFSLSTRHCQHTCNMARNYLQAGHVILP